MRAQVVIWIVLGWPGLSAAQSSREPAADEPPASPSPAFPSSSSPPASSLSAASLSAPAPAPDALLLDGAVDPSTYVIGPGDRLSIELWGLQELSTHVEVDADGRVFVPRLGVIDAGGRTLAALRKRVQARVHAVYPRLQGTVRLARPRSFLVHVTGAVAHPGSYAVTALTRVSTAIARAGGALAGGSSRRVEVRHRGQTAAQLADLTRFLLFGDAGGDPLLLDGDTVFVPLRQRTVEVTGAVRRPGRYELVPGYDLRQLLALAGGETAEAAASLPLRITSRGAGDALAVRSVQADAGIELRDGDVVHVPELADLHRVVTVEGAVVGPPELVPAGRAPPPPSDDRAEPLDGRRERSITLPFVEGDGIRDLLTKVRGLQPWADGRAAYILRPDGKGRRRRIAVDVPAIAAGRAPEVRLAALDTLVVPSRRDSVLVGGAVQRPGVYQFHLEMRPEDYINLAGGPRSNADLRGARVLSLSGGPSKRLRDVHTIDPGDSISVPEKKISTAEWVSITLILTNLAVATAALAVTATR